MNNYKQFLKLIILILCLYPSLYSDGADKTKAKIKAEKGNKPIIKNIVSDCKTQVTLSQIVSKPENWLNKEICFSGVFSSFSSLALDYPPALRERKKYMSMLIFRPNTKIPLSEFKLAMKLEDAQKHEYLSKLTEGDDVKIKGKVFSVALGEPWVDIIQIQVIPNPNNKQKNKQESGFEDL